MIDTLEYNRKEAAIKEKKEIFKSNALINDSTKIAEFLKYEEFGLITMHRPSNVDNKCILEAIVDWIILDASVQIPLIWPIHPRTVKQLQNFNIWNKLINCKNLLLLHPIGYLEMLRLNMDAKLMLTDSGGLQEECCVLGTPFLTFRFNTERPVTLLEFGGAGYLVGNNINSIKRDFDKIIKEKRNPIRPQLWDGHTAERCLKEIINFKKS
jgi:UDP-N-acetylglucosamine 2-epimerase (non-hydrolysing)